MILLGYPHPPVDYDIGPYLAYYSWSGGTPGNIAWAPAWELSDSPVADCPGWRR